MRFYVYALAYPDGSIFYVGKGTGDRIQGHEQEARTGGTSRKCEIIREIWARGDQVDKTKLAFFDTDEEALAYEASMIASLNGLANIQQGRKRINDILLVQSDLDDFGGQLRQRRNDGTMFWSAREVAEFLGYVTWSSFQQVIQQAKRSAGSTGWSEQEHFQPTYKRVRNGLRGHRSIEDYQLSREAFWLVVQHGDALKWAVMFGKSVMAMQSAIFDNAARQGRSDGSRDAGFRGLYGGLSENDIRAVKGLPAGEDILNWMGPEEFADNLFRITLTKEKLLREQVRGREQINQIHFEVGQRVRNLIINELGGTRPELLPTPAKSIQQLEYEERDRLKHREQLSLFDLPPEELS